ncbi:hypothetical protein bcgnr5401_11470 [Bacillus cereus]|nr:hypothetical protein BCACH14_19310 [Bacillus cereus]
MKRYLLLKTLVDLSLEILVLGKYSKVSKKEQGIKRCTYINQKFS